MIIDESNSLYYHIYMKDFLLRVYRSQSTRIAEIWSKDGLTEYGRIPVSLVSAVSGTRYFLMEDANGTPVDIITRTANLIQILIVGQLVATDGVTAYPGLNSVSVLLSIYPDMIVCDFSAPRLLAFDFDPIADATGNCIFGVFVPAPVPAGVQTVWDNNGTEVYETSAVREVTLDVGSYVGMVSDWLSVTLITTGTTRLEPESTQWVMVANQPGSIRTSFNDCALTTKDHYSAALILRPGPSSATERQALAKQFAMKYQFNEAFLRPGAIIDDYTWPSSPGIINQRRTGRVGDGALHLTSKSFFPQSGNDDIVLYTDRDRSNEAILVEDWQPYSNGNLLCPLYMKMDDNRNDWYGVTNEYGTNNCTWINTDGSGTRYTSSDSVIDERNRVLKTGYAAVKLNPNNFDTLSLTKGSFVVKFKPMYGPVGLGNRSIFRMYIDADNAIHVYFHGTTQTFRITTIWGGVSVTALVSAARVFADDREFQRYITIHAWWDANIDRFGLCVDGNLENWETNTGTPAQVAPVAPNITLMVNYDLTLPFYTYLASFRYFKEALWPAVDFPTYEHIASDYSLADPDILAYWNCAGTTLQIGGGPVTLTGTPIVSGLFGSGCEIVSGRAAYFAVNQSLPDFQVSCWYRNTTTPAGSETIWDIAGAIKLQRGASNTELVLVYNGTSITFSGLNIDIFDGLEHHIRVRGDASAGVWELFIDCRLDGKVKQTVTALGTVNGDLYVGSAQAGADPANGVISEFFLTRADLDPVWGGPGIRLEHPLVTVA